LGLFWLCTLDFGPKLALIGFELGLFFRKIIVFGRIMKKIGFVLHKKVYREYSIIERVPKVAKMPKVSYIRRIG